MFWVGIISNELVGLWKVNSGVKMTSSAYIKFSKGQPLDMA